MTGDVTTRNKMLKLIPHIDSGNWVVRQAVGTKPVITGKVCVCGGGLGISGRSSFEHLAVIVATYAVALHTGEALILLVFHWGLPARRL